MKSLFLILSCVGFLAVVECAMNGCATTNVNIRSGPSTSYRRLDLLTRGRCLPYKGLSSDRKWARVDYNGRTAWIYKRYLSIRGTPSTPTQGCPRIISRSEWGARAPRSSSRMSRVPSRVFIHHGTGGRCTTMSSCKEKVRGYQRYHMNSNGWSDIGYSFIIGEDGNVYEGRGWMKIGAHTAGYNSVGYGFCVIGDFTSRVPNNAAQNALKRLIQCGISKGYLRSGYSLSGHRDVGSTSCPGTAFYNTIKNWANYVNPRG